MLNCPHCGERTISPIKKLFLGPAFDHRCPACRKHWAISHWSIAAGVACIAGYWVFLQAALPSPLAARIAMGIAFVVLGLALVFVVPVVRK